VDRRGDAAIRSQWTRVANLIDAQGQGKITPQVVGEVREDFPTAKVGDKLTPEMTRIAFGNSYRQAVEEAGPPPKCEGWIP
jgi:hypothetical protein